MSPLALPSRGQLSLTPAVTETSLHESAAEVPSPFRKAGGREVERITRFGVGTV